MRRGKRNTCRHCFEHLGAHVDRDQHENTCLSNPEVVHSVSRDAFTTFRQSMGEALPSAAAVASMQDVAIQAATQHKEDLKLIEAAKVTPSDGSHTSPPKRGPSKGRYRSNTVVVIGGAGCGKSSTLTSLMSELAATAGESEEGDNVSEFDIFCQRFKSRRSDYTIIDPPGHPDFIRNVIMGAFQADCVLFVVDSTKEWIEGELYEENLLLMAFTLGVREVICCLSKMDATTPAYSKERHDALKMEVISYLKKLGYKNILFVPVSGFDEENLTKRSHKLDWYKGPTLVEVLDAIDPPTREVEPLRLPIQTVMGTRMVGRVYAGTIERNQQIQFGPGVMRSKVQKITFNTKEVSSAMARQVVQFVTVPAVPVEPGFMISSKQHPAKEASRFFSRVLVINLADKFKVGSQFSLVSISAGVRVRISNILSLVDKTTGNSIRNNPDSLKVSEVADVELVCQRAVFLERVSVGRFMLENEEGVVVAVGVVHRIEREMDKTTSKRKSKGKGKKK